MLDEDCYSCTLCLMMIATIHLLLDDDCYNTLFAYVCYSYTLMMIATTTHFCLMMITTVTLIWWWLLPLHIFVWWWLLGLHVLFDNHRYTFCLIKIAANTLLALWWLTQLHFFWQWLLQLHFLFVPSVSECDLLHIWGCLSVRTQYMDHICCSIMGRVTWRCSICQYVLQDVYWGKWFLYWKYLASELLHTAFNYNSIYSLISSLSAVLILCASIIFCSSSRAKFHTAT